MSHHLSSSAGKEFAYNAGDSNLIPGSERSAEEGIGYPFQHSWASLVAQLVKNLTAMQETPVWFLGLKDPLEKGNATHSSVLAWRIPWLYSPRGHKESDTTERPSLSHFLILQMYLSWNVTQWLHLPWHLTLRNMITWKEIFINSLFTLKMFTEKISWP